jgi:hypothetical protein
MRYAGFSDSLSERLTLLQSIDAKERTALDTILLPGAVEEDYIHGACRDMCPETERYFRTVSGGDFLTWLEFKGMTPTSTEFDHALAIKA